MNAKNLWITDPWETLDHPMDTTLRLMEESLLQSIPTYWCDVKSIRFQQGAVLIDAQKLLESDSPRSRSSFEFSETHTFELREFHFLHYRPDPPVDLNYLHPLQLLVLGLHGRKSTFIINRPEVLFMSNEKLLAGAMADCMPPSIVSSQWDVLSAFGIAEGRTVLKPLHQAQGKGVVLLDWKSDAGRIEAKRIISETSLGFYRPIMLQKYLTGIEQGETRIWFAKGNCIAHITKLPAPGSFKVDIDRGSQLEVKQLSVTEKKLIPLISKHLKKLDISMAAVDLIENQITDFNFTSPGLIPEMEKILSENLARMILREFRVQKSL